MKKLLFILSLFFSTTGFAQTKEESITWLKEKLEKYLVSDRYSRETIKDIKVASIDACRFTITMTGIRDDGSVHKYSDTFPTAVDSLSYAGTFKYTGAKILCDADGTKDYRTWSGIHIAEDAEENIIKRVEKALKHLSTFCETKKETF